MAEAFSDIYRRNVWGEFKSGDGSAPWRNRRYIHLVERFMRTRNVRSVVDLGCGDWSFSQYIRWGDASYHGIDVVPEVAVTNTRRYGRANVRFTHGDLLTTDLPSADLALMKDVLQHWSTDAILAMLPRLCRFRYVILTNDVAVWRFLHGGRLRPARIGVTNAEIAPGGWRPLDLRRPPFGLEATVLAQLPVVKLADRTLHWKQSLLLQ